MPVDAWSLRPWLEQARRHGVRARAREFPLTKVPELRVPARTSSFSFKGKQATIADIAKALGVANVLEGSVRKSGKHLRITAELVRADKARIRKPRRTRSGFRVV
jgi:hypothetical protein